MPRWLWISACAGCVALAIAAAMRWQVGEAGVAGMPESPALAESGDSARARADTRPEPGESGELPRIPRELLADNRDLGTGESAELLARLPTEIDYPLQEKYEGQVWSQVPHELIAAHDGQQEHEGEGARRLFIAVVEPGLPDDDIERLVRDLRSRHREAEALRVRVFDSREAATRPSWTDGGAARKEHLVADLYRELGSERLFVRGRAVDP